MSVWQTPQGTGFSIDLEPGPSYELQPKAKGTWILHKDFSRARNIIPT